MQTYSKNGSPADRLRLARAVAEHVAGGCDFREAGRRVGVRPDTARVFCAYNLPAAEWRLVVAARASRPRPGFPREHPQGRAITAP